MKVKETVSSLIMLGLEEAESLRNGESNMSKRIIIIMVDEDVWVMKLNFMSLFI